MLSFNESGQEKVSFLVRLICDMSGTTENRSAVEILTTDHRLFRELFAKVKAAKDKPEKQRLANQIIDAIAPHSVAEEQVLYPTIRNTARDPKAADRSINEHQQVRVFKNSLFSILIFTSAAPIVEGGPGGASCFES